MKTYEATEQAYKNGYKKGYEDGKRDAVKKGRWIERQEPLPWCEDDVAVFFECSICGIQSSGESPYCPNCGADMRGEEDGK